MKAYAQYPSWTLHIKGGSECVCVCVYVTV